MKNQKRKKKVDPAVSAAMSKLGKKSWAARQAKILGKVGKKKNTEKE